LWFYCGGLMGNWKKKPFGTSHKKKDPDLIAFTSLPPTLEDIKDALVRNRGIVGLAAKDVGLDPMALYFAITKTAALANVWNIVQEMVRDEAREMLLKAAKSGESWAVKFILTEGKREVPAFIESSSVVELKIAKPKNAKVSEG